MEPPEVHGVIPTGRWGHSSILLNDMLLVFYGGVDADMDLLSEIFAFDTGLYLPCPSLPFLPFLPSEWS